MSRSEPVYLDFNATTPVAPEVLEAMLPWFTRFYGNASSTHAHGQVAAGAVRDARVAVSDALGVPAAGIVFTSGATEADNVALRGVRGRVVVAATEHKAVLDTAAALDHSVVPVDQAGRIDLEALERAADGAALLSVMLANNETGVLQDLEAVAEIGKRHGCLVHTDATQAFGKVDVNFEGVDLVSVSAHKIYGPKGVGALYVRRGVELDSIMTGGGHERGLRSGTSNIPGIVGFGAAAGRLQVELDASRARALLDRLVHQLRGLEPFEVFSDHGSGLPNTLSIRFEDADAEAVIANSAEISISTGSACTAAVPAPSHVLLAMGVPAQQAFETLRISVGRPTTEHDIDVAVATLRDAIRRVRAFSSNTASVAVAG